MFIQAETVHGTLIYFDFESLQSLTLETGEICFSSGAFAILTKVSAKNVFDRMCRGGKIAGLGAGAERTKDYPNVES